MTQEDQVYYHLQSYNKNHSCPMFHIKGIFRALGSDGVTWHIGKVTDEYKIK